MFITFFISDNLRLLCKADAAISQLGLVRTGQGLSDTGKFLPRPQGYPGIHVVLIKKTFQMDHFEDSGAGSQSGRPPAPYGCVSLNGVFVPAQLGKGVRQWSAEETTTEKSGPGAVSPPLCFGRGTRNPLWAGAVKADGSQLCSIFVIYFWLS